VDTDIDVSGQASSAADAVQLTDADWRMLEDNFGFRPRTEKEHQPSPFDAATLEVDLTAGRDVWLRRRANPRMSIELGGDVDLRKQPNEPLQIFGTMEARPQRSTLEQYGRQLDVETGEVVLNGPPEKAEVKLVAKYEVASIDNPREADVTVRVGVKGPADNLRLELSSDPAMDESSIMQALVTGRAPAAAGTGQSGTEGQTGLAVGQASAVVEEFAPGLGLDVLQIRPDGVRGATLVAGRYVNTRTYLGMRQSATLESESSSSSSSGAQTEVEVEYELVDWMLVNLQGGAGSGRFLLRSRYAY
jgi:translocation and assembly module TamB